MSGFRDMKLTNVKKTCCDKDCPDRSIGCHGRCDKYQAYRAECDEVAQQRYQKRCFERDMDRLAYRASERLPGKRSF